MLSSKYAFKIILMLHSYITENSASEILNVSSTICCCCVLFPLCYAAGCFFSSLFSTLCVTDELPVHPKTDITSFKTFSQPIDD